MKRILFILLFVTLSCSTTQNNLANSFYIAEGVSTTLMPPALYGGELSLSHILRARYNGRERSVTGVVTITGERMSVAGLSGPVRLYRATLFADGHVESSASSLLPAELPEPEYILSDIQLIYFPYKALDKHLPGGMSVTESRRGNGFERRIYSGKSLVAAITYSSPDIASADIELVNVERNYSYTIRHAEQSR